MKRIVVILPDVAAQRVLDFVIAALEFLLPANQYVVTLDDAPEDESHD